MYTSQLNIGLTYYQETQWISAINKYGTGILDKSLLSREQKDVLTLAALREKQILGK